MKKVLLFIAAAICSVTAASAQMTEGDSSISAKVGFCGGYGVPITVTYEKALWGINEASCVTLGGTVAYGSVGDAYYRVSDFIIGARGTYHYVINKWDLLGGVTLGYDVASVNWKNEYKYMKDVVGNPSNGGLFFGINVGANYYFKENWAVGAEIGYGLATINLGVTYKF